MKVSPAGLDGILILEPRVFRDERGVFLESWQGERYAQLGIKVDAQDNVSWSYRGVVRGLHFQHPRAQAKLIYVLSGAVYDVAVDIRQGSPTFGNWMGLQLDAENRRQLYLPPGFAHGFCVLSQEAVLAYKCSDVYCAEFDRAIRWNDPQLGIDWPVIDPIVSAKDAAAPLLSAMAAGSLPPMRPGGD